MEKKDYSLYSYGDFLEYLDREYEHSTDPTDYADVMLKMNSTKSFNKLLSVYNVLDELEPLKDSDYSESKQRISVYEVIYKIDYEALNQCYNENLVRLYKELDGHDKKIFSKYYINIRECKNSNTFKSELLRTAKCSFGIDYSTLAAEIDDKKSSYYESIGRIQYLEKGTNGYKKEEKVYFTLLNFIKKAGYIRSKSELYLRKKLDLFYLPNELGWTSRIICVFSLIAYVILFSEITDYFEIPFIIGMLLNLVFTSLAIWGGITLYSYLKS